MMLHVRQEHEAPRSSGSWQNGASCSGSRSPSIRCSLFTTAVIPEPWVMITSSGAAWTCALRIPGPLVRAGHRHPGGARLGVGVAHQRTELSDSRRSIGP